MLATINMPHTVNRRSETAHRSSSQHPSLPRRTSFLIKDILGTAHDAASDSEQDSLCSENTSTTDFIQKPCPFERLQDKLDDTRSKSCVSSPLSSVSCRECSVQRDNNRSPLHQKQPAPFVRSFSGQSSPTDQQVSWKGFSDRIVSNKFRDTFTNSLCETQEIATDQQKNGLKQSNHMLSLQPHISPQKQSFSFGVRRYSQISPVSERKLDILDEEAQDQKKSIQSQCDSHEQNHFQHSLFSSSVEDNRFFLKSEERLTAEGLKTSTVEESNPSISDKMRESPVYANHPYNGFLMNPPIAPLIDLRYAYCVRANDLAVSTLPLSLFKYPASADSLELQKDFTTADLTNISNFAIRPPLPLCSKYEPYATSRFAEWRRRNKVQENFNRDSMLNSCIRRQSVSPLMNDKQASFFDSHSPEACFSSPTQSCTPPSSSLSSSSLSSPEKRSIQLPVYLRSRLGGSSVANDVSTNGEIGKAKKCRRSRTVFTELQMLGLEKRFEKQQYLSTPDRVELAEILSLTQLQVKTWYQNRRMKWKKQVLQGGGTEPPTKPKGRPRKVRPEEETSSKNTTLIPSPSTSRSNSLMSSCK